MIIQRISSNRAASNLYVFNNNNYQVNNVPVNPVKPVKKLPGLEKGEEQKRPAAIYQQNGGGTAEAAGTKQIDAIKNEYMSAGKAEYNTDNIYERQRMAAESTVLTGMNYDTYA